ncbi:MAG: hypothetical protein JNJ63_12745 [Hyphomonadaceae bacterium]|nr:hypothetical protein [Hyphomonadaceae bacterium]
MNIGSITSNPLFSTASRTNAAQAGGSVWSNLAQRPANSAAQTSPLPVSSATPLSFDTILHLQSADDPRPAKPEAPSATDKFLEEAQKSPIQRMREQILEQLGLTEDAIAQMPADERRATEDKIREMIEEKLRQASGADNQAPDSNAAMIEAVA